MSDSIALALIIATFFPAFLCFIYMTKVINDVGMDVLSGTADDRPISTTYRWIMLHQIWAPQVSAIVACLVLASMINFQIAATVTEAGIRAIAYGAALIGGAGALGWLLNGLSAYIHYRSVLRQAKAG